MWNEFITALQFLTRIRLVREPACDEQSFGRCVAFFPLVGVVAGTILALAALATGGWLPATVRSILLVSLWIFITGGLHCDGLMDTADGVLSGRSPQRMLEIMKDSRVGAFGVVAMILLVLWKWALIHDMPASLLAPALISMMAFGRFGMVLVILRFPYAREEGMGKAFSLYAGRRSLWIAITTVLLLLAALWLFSGALIAVCAAVAALASAGFALLFGSWLTGKLGGLTGDMYGAATELAEVVALLTFILSAYIK
jgi:adenosylcobinamide-GDP ribazoletransferase